MENDNSNKKFCTKNVKIAGAITLLLPTIGYVCYNLYRRFLLKNKKSEQSSQEQAPQEQAPQEQAPQEQASQEQAPQEQVSQE